jgi:hypothetical protein
VLANCILRNPEERFNKHLFIEYLEERLLPAMNPFNGENPQSVLVMDEYINCMHACITIIYLTYIYAPNDFNLPPVHI